MSPLREQGAADTRLRILAPARRLFATIGVERTTVRRVADAAGVAVPTLYASVCGKPAVLRGVLEQLSAAHEQPVRSLNERNPRDRLRAMAHVQGEFQGRHGELVEVLRGAESDPTSQQPGERARTRGAKR